MKVLIAEDSLTVRTLVERLLAHAGYQVESAEDGLEALEALHKTDPAPIVILDWMMPGKSGIEVLAAIRQKQHTNYTYILMLTAMSASKDIVAGLDAGADDYLVKPFEPEELLARVRAAERALKIQADLLKTIEDQQQLLRRHNLLGDLLRKQQLPADKTQLMESPFPPEASATAYSGPLAALPVMGRVDHIFADALGHMGVFPLSSLDPGPLGALVSADFMAWTALIALPQAVWLDVQLEMDRPSALAMGLAVRQTLDVTDEDVLDMLGETLNVFQNFFKTAFDRGSDELMMPFVPRAHLTRDLPLLPAPGNDCGHGRYLISQPGMDFRLTLTQHPAHEEELQRPGTARRADAEHQGAARPRPGKCKQRLGAGRARLGAQRPAAAPPQAAGALRPQGLGGHRHTALAHGPDLGRAAVRRTPLFSIFPDFRALPWRAWPEWPSRRFSGSCRPSRSRPSGGRRRA